MIDVIKEKYGHLPEKKKWIDLITAVLSVPLLVTVLISNVNNLKAKKQDTVSQQNVMAQKAESGDKMAVSARPTAKNEPTGTPVPTVPVSPTPSNSGSTGTPVPTCIPGPQPISISYPAEGKVISSDPVAVSLDFSGSGYCPLEWAYRVNSSSWSSYSSNPIYLYNMVSGEVRLEIKIRSTVTGKENDYIRNFVYNNPATATPTPTDTPVPTVAP